MTPDPLWCLGGPWRDLGGELAAGPVTVVTESRSTHLLDAPGGWRRRVPRGGVELGRDGDRVTLREIRIATPCGLEVAGDDPADWLVTTRLTMVLPGHEPAWEAHPAGQEILATGWGLWDLTGHPTGSCGARWCPLAA